MLRTGMHYEGYNFGMIGSGTPPPPFPLSQAEWRKEPGEAMKEGWKDLEENEIPGGALLSSLWELQSQG